MRGVSKRRGGERLQRLQSPALELLPFHSRANISGLFLSPYHPITLSPCHPLLPLALSPSPPSHPLLPLTLSPSRPLTPPPSPPC